MNPANSKHADEGRQRLLELLSTSPQPIVDSQHKLVLLWSAKSGCTFAIKWMFDHMGLLQEALAHHSWIHYFRTDKLYKSDAHQASMQDFVDTPEAYRVVKIVRNPFKRALSSYIHASQCGYEDAHMAVFLSRPVDMNNRYSFREFVAYLETIDLNACNEHHRLQAHRLERAFVPGTRYVIDLDHSMTLLPRLEDALGLPRSKLSRYRKSHHHTRTSSSVATGFSGDALLSVTRESKDKLPAYRRFYDADLERRVYNLYAEDFLLYGFATTLDT
ncbi:MAG: sulfotransferase family 2 domain-containing protein [Gammaproteobacteria bacterium]